MSFLLDDQQDDIRGQLLQERKLRQKAEQKYTKLLERVKKAQALPTEIIEEVEVSVPSSPVVEHSQGDPGLVALYSPSFPRSKKPEDTYLSSARVDKLLSESSNAKADFSTETVTTNNANDQQLAELKRLNEECQKLKAERTDLQKQLLDQSEAIRIVQKGKAVSDTTLDVTRDLTIKLKDALEAKMEEIIKLKQEIEELKKHDQRYKLVCNEKLQLEVDKVTWGSKYTMINEEKNKLAALCREKDETIQGLESLIESKDDTIEKMARKLLNLKNRIDNVEVQMCKFFVKKVYKFFYTNTDATLVVSKAPTTAVYSLDIFTNGKRTTHPFDTIQSILKHTDSTTRFTIQYTDAGHTDVFESAIREEVLNALYGYYKKHTKTAKKKKELQERKGKKESPTKSRPPSSPKKDINGKGNDADAKKSGKKVSNSPTKA
mmetsp:Transcript_28575/g.31744  ORF Transcript_28575/g.31744 Transcript_28575/m.31744 type:complete len:434 (-) Transcript_28575:79-1380(-)